jgi:hypothetical protein
VLILLIAEAIAFWNQFWTHYFVIRSKEHEKENEWMEKS